MANEKRLIDANALLEKIQFRLPVVDIASKCISDCVAIARKTVVEAPTVDAVEVVHGRWIEKREIPSYSNKNIPVVECAKAYKGIVRPDDTCEHGVRRTPKGE